jgi:hypothetical protein
MGIQCSKCSCDREDPEIKSEIIYCDDITVPTQRVSAQQSPKQEKVYPNTKIIKIQAV